MEDKTNVLESLSPIVPVKPILDMLSITITDMETRISKLEAYVIWSMQDKGLPIAQINKILDGKT